ncbi:RNA-directed DNA polymerase, eukaryota, partial [Tanacetum coccineum]
VQDSICKFAKKGLTPSQIGVILRDSHGIAQVNSVTGSKILRILKAHGLAPEIPEDLYHLIKKAVAIRKHLERNRKDKDSKFRLILVESRIHRLARYYKKTKKLPPVWKPISLIGSLYKIIAKILANRLVGVLGDIVNEVQYAFIADRQILDGPFILNEMLQWCKVKKKQSLIFKVDFEKAYDSVRWDFLDDVLSVGLRINMSKSKIMGVYVDSDKVKRAALKLGCLILKPPFLYLGLIVGGSMSRVHAWISCRTVKNRRSKFGDEVAPKNGYPRIYALESSKSITVGMKVAQPSLAFSFRRAPRGGVEQEQFDEIVALVNDVILAPISDRWTWTLESSGDFSVASVRKLIDDKSIPVVDYKTRWIKYVPIKVNVHAWKVKSDSLPTRFNISRRGIYIDSIMCAICDKGAETSSHLFFSCCMVRQAVRLITRWWDVPYMEFESYDGWLAWPVNLRLPYKNKMMLEGVFYVTWWHLWTFRTKLFSRLRLQRRRCFLMM